MFARAELLGRPVPNVIELSNAALSPDGHVLVVSEESRLERRDVGIINRQGASVWVSGIASGERVVTQLNNTLFPGLRVATQRAVN
jgi:non-ribosomal peptide synthetase component E (peptide arylation enzyme)